MIKTLTPHGNSAALILDKPVLELLKISYNTPLEISTDGTRLIITPVSSGNGHEISHELSTVALPKGQDQESGAAANRWGLAMGKAVARGLGGVPLSPGNNEMVYEGGRWVVKSAHNGVIEIGVTKTMLGRLTGILAVLEDRNGEYDLYRIEPTWYRERMRPNRVIPRIMMVRCNEIKRELKVFRHIAAPKL